ncbi:glucose-1-phosphate adenylyltransferase subunit GlgD [Litorilinea aerophila]|nr:glucose-1-phosphate adenylyltransferase subunit GlgD [Litorilinea aerophila]MCC9077424.1 glucose-1-phosphate adenylyltransferase subunit GlgD [Litorilinea aerophila]GIV80042.1 MAG: glucose-1-phosphate adenylyltransferase [Litorilinea sp.]
MTRAFAMIMAGGSSESLSVLTEVRAEPAVPFGGKFRLIDFPLSNCVNSDIYNVAVLTQYRPRSLNDHIGIGKPWDLDRATGGVRLLQPYRGGPYGDWQQGTADAVRRNLDFVQLQQEEHVLILAGDHIYLMDYRPMLYQHIQSNADLTVAVRRVNPYETHRFGIVSVGAENRIVEFQEKPKRSRETLASMGIYIFRKEVLVEVLENSDYIDFGSHVLPGMLQASYAIHAYTFPGYWADVGTIQAYWEANMSLLAENPALDLYDPEWVVHTRSEERAPVKIGPNAQVNGNLLSNGCRVDGLVERSVLSPGVYVAEGAVVRDSIILNDTVIEAGAVVDRAIIDKGVVVGAGARVGDGDDNTPNEAMPQQINTGLTLVGKQSVIPPNLVIGRNVVVHAYSDAKAFGKRKKVPSGADIGKNLR